MQRDTICLEDFILDVYLGVSANERKTLQPIHFDVRIGFDTRRAAASDKLADTLDYEAVFNTIQQIAQEKRYNLLETLCARAAKAVLEMGAAQIWIKATKISPPIKGMTGRVSVEIERHAGI